MKESVKNDGCLRNGFITEERPTHAYGDETQALLPWHDVELPKKTPKTSGGEGKGKGTRKCGNCGECGHNKKTCPLLKGETEKKVEQVVSTVRAALTEVVEQVVDEPVPEDDGAGVGLHLIEPQANPCGAEEVMEKDYQMNAAGNSTPKTEPEPEPEAEPETEQPSDSLEEYKVIQSYESDGRQYEVEIHTPNPHYYQNDPKTKDISKLDDESPKTEPLSDEELEEDQSGETITFQGVEYTFDSEENMVYDDELAEVGTWDGEKIEFLNTSAAKLHRVRKLALKND
jgi:hypothetical protein